MPCVESDRVPGPAASLDGACTPAAYHLMLFELFPRFFEDIKKQEEVAGHSHSKLTAESTLRDIIKSNDLEGAPAARPERARKRARGADGGGASPRRRALPLSLSPSRKEAVRERERERARRGAHTYFIAGVGV